MGEWKAGQSAVPLVWTWVGKTVSMKVDWMVARMDILKVH
jgi:hypothetical protein